RSSVIGHRSSVIGHRSSVIKEIKALNMIHVSFRCVGRESPGKTTEEGIRSSFYKHSSKDSAAYEPKASTFD
ncbi:MAG: hypothetical protein AAF598_00890, partial [Bacteroidota bacterium]